jgi:hypothetical protein
LCANAPIIIFEHYNKRMQLQIEQREVCTWTSKLYNHTSWTSIHNVPHIGVSEMNLCLASVLYKHWSWT